jgi:hypothetical protein
MQNRPRVRNDVRRVITKGIVKERMAARKEFDQAVARGTSVQLLEQQRTDIFELVIRHVHKAIYDLRETRISPKIIPFYASERGVIKSMACTTCRVWETYDQAKSSRFQ